MRHVAHGVDVDEKTDAGDHAEHHQREVVHAERKVNTEA